MKTVSIYCEGGTESLNMIQAITHAAWQLQWSKCNTSVWRHQTLVLHFNQWIYTLQSI